MNKTNQLCILQLILILWLGPEAATAAQNQFTIDDYFKTNVFTELSISSDGDKIAYVVERQSLETNNSVRSVYVRETTPNADPLYIAELQDARDFAWIPKSNSLAFLKTVDGQSQVYSLDIVSKAIRQHTHGDASVVSFRFAPNGLTLGWITRNELGPPGSIGASTGAESNIYYRLFHGDRGIEIDSENLSITNFVNPERPNLAARPHHSLWVKHGGNEASLIQLAGQPKTINWSSDASKLSVVFVADDLLEEPFSDRFTSIAVYDLSTKGLHEIASANLRLESGDSEYFSGGEWVTGKHRLLIRRTTEQDIWTTKTDWSLVSVAADRSVTSGIQKWREITVYGLFGDTLFIPVDESRIYYNTTIKAKQSLYQITQMGPVRADIIQGVDGSISLFRFGAGFKTAVFVNQSLTRPPEIFVWRDGDKPYRLTNLNMEIAERQLPSAREVTWESSDGVTVQGWLLEPGGERFDSSSPRPVVTFVHGGPGIPVTDVFAFYFKAYGGLWPYPFNSLALNNVTVFFPNYRGTRTFGKEFAQPANGDGEPIDDIITGLEHLISEGIADPNRLGIIGHSHGAWLGSLVMTRSKLFQAASFAEGAQNRIVTYHASPGWLNRVTHDVKIGASLYDNPERYVEVSPDLHFSGLETAVLFEAGAKSLAMVMMGSPKAAKRAGMPAEFIVYPQTGHNIRLPRLQRESAVRNLDWFLFWLLEEEDNAPEKHAQYQRWRKMRTQQIDGQ